MATWTRTRCSAQALLHVALVRSAGSGEEASPGTGGAAWSVTVNPFTYLDAIEAEICREGQASGA